MRGPMETYITFYVVIWIIFAIVSILGTIFWIWTIIDCATKEPAQGNDKIIWLMIIIFTGVGSLIYYFVRRPERRKMFGR